MAANDFASFQEAHPRYKAAYEYLAAADEALALSAATVHTMQGPAMGPMTEDIFKLATDVYGDDLMPRYLARIRYLNELQARFDVNPTTANLCGPRVDVDRDAYNIALLLSIVFSNHRFEVISRLGEFFDFVKGPPGKLVSIGMGTGYELVLAARKLPKWRIEGFDTNAKARDVAKQALKCFEVQTPVEFGELFPLDTPSSDFVGKYDAISCCELLEHLANPLEALRTLRDCLSPRGRLFATMAVNIAQEDHIHLYDSVASCRKQLTDAGLAVIAEWTAPMSVTPFAEAERGARFRRGNYIAVTKRASK